MKILPELQPIFQSELDKKLVDLGDTGFVIKLPKNKFAICTKIYFNLSYLILKKSLNRASSNRGVLVDAFANKWYDSAMGRKRSKNDEQS